MARRKKDTEIAGVTVAKKKAIFAKEYAKTGDRYKAAKKAGVPATKRNSNYYVHSPEVVAITNAVRHQARTVAALTMDEVKQLAAEMAMVSPIDLTEADGTINIVEIKKRGLGRFVKEIEQDITIDKDGNKTISVKLKGYSRLDALKLVATIQKDEESRDIQIVQAMASLFMTHKELQKDKARVFSRFASKFNLSQDHIEGLFDRLGSNFMLERGDIE